MRLLPTLLLPSFTLSYVTRRRNQPLGTTSLMNRVSNVDEAVQQQIEEYLKAREERSNQLDDYMYYRGNSQGSDHYSTTQVSYPSQIDEYLKARSMVDSTHEMPENKDQTNSEQLLQKIKEMGPAGIISYGVVQIAFQGLSFVICLGLFYKTTGHWPDFSDPEDAAAFGGGAFAFVNVARLAVPLRMALAFGGASWIQKNILDPKKTER